MTAVVTLTLNPALDLTTSVDVVSPTHKLRCDPATAEAGGGGVNVARVASRLGVTAVAVLPTGGSTGQRLVQQLDTENTPHIGITFGEETRQSFTVNERTTGNQFRFVMPGSPLDDATLQRCHDTVLAAASDASVLAISGSMPDGVPPGFLHELVTAADQLGVAVLIDTSGPALTEALDSPARLVKPSARELAAALGRDLISEADVEAGLLEVAGRSRARAVVVSIGAGGALAFDRDEGYMRFQAPIVRVSSAVGAGDSMVAGMAVAIARGQSINEAVHLGVAAGTAAVLTAGSELCTPDDVSAMLALVRPVS